MECLQLALACFHVHGCFESQVCIAWNLRIPANGNLSSWLDTSCRAMSLHAERGLKFWQNLQAGSSDIEVELQTVKTAAAAATEKVNSTPRVCSCFEERTLGP